MHEAELGRRGLGLNSVFFPLLHAAFPPIPFMKKGAERPIAVAYLPHKFCFNGRLLMQYLCHDHVRTAEDMRCVEGLTAPPAQASLRVFEEKWRPMRYDWAVNRDSVRAPSPSWVLPLSSGLSAAEWLLSVECGRENHGLGALFLKWKLCFHLFWKGNKLKSKTLSAISASAGNYKASTWFRSYCPQ